jgi:thioesterase domain-containing protein
MTTHDLERYLHDRIPLTRHMELRVAALDAGGLTLSAPLAPNINDKNTAFAGSISALLTLSGWTLLHALLDGNATGLQIAVTESQLSFSRPVRGELRAVCDHPGEEVIQSVRKALIVKGKARVSLHARIMEESSLCADFQGTYAVHRQ